MNYIREIAEALSENHAALMVGAGFSKNAEKIAATEKTFLNWNFNSLFQAIELILAFNETNERKEVKMCKHCFKPFIAKNLNSDYDTASCRNVANVYRSRAKNK